AGTRLLSRLGRAPAAAVDRDPRRGAPGPGRDLAGRCRPRRVLLARSRTDRLARRLAVALTALFHEFGELEPALLERVLLPCQRAQFAVQLHQALVVARVLRQQGVQFGLAGGEPADP